MSLHIHCDVCGELIRVPGALLFSPPKNDPAVAPMNVDKIHICIECWRTDFLSILKKNPLHKLECKEGLDS